jgi:hypothetical protein
MNNIENMITDLKNESLIRWNHEKFMSNVTDYRKVVSPLQGSVISSALPAVTMSFHSNDISTLPLPIDNVVKLMGLGVGVDFFIKRQLQKAYPGIRICCGFYDNEHMIRVAMGSDLDGVSVRGKGGTDLLAD